MVAGFEKVSKKRVLGGGGGGGLGLPFNIYRLISFKFFMMIEIKDLYLLIPV